MYMTLLGFLFPTTGLSATYDVGSSQTFATISDAIAVAIDGDTIQVHAGTYAENVTIDDLDITVIGVGGTASTIIGASGNVFTVDDSDVTISAFTVTPS
ncbi:MAG: hypothetical protein HN348_02300, partial [Proteobacteria bacterium]|nr:hypothetical protein [Pseudomonadota bacterium]